MVRAESAVVVEDSPSDAVRSASGPDGAAIFSDRTGRIEKCLVAAHQVLSADMDVLCLRLWELSAEGDVLVLQAALGPVVPFDGLGERVPTARSELGEVVHRGEPYVVTDLSTTAPQEVRVWADANGVASFAAVPIQFEQQSLGVLAAFCRMRLEEQQLVTLQRLARLIAPHFRNAPGDASGGACADLLPSLIQCLPSAVVTLDRQGLITRWNASAERLFGWSDVEVFGKPLPFVLEERKDEFLHDADHPPASGVLRTRTVCQRADGSLCHVHRSSTLVYDQRGDVSGRVEVFVDESHRVRTSRSLQVQSQVTRIAARCRSLEEATPLLLAAVGEWLACEAAEFWILEQDERTLSRPAVWASTSTARDRLAASEVRMKGEATAWPATSLNDRRPAYCAEVDSSAARALSPVRGALRLPVRGLTIPMRAAEAPLGVITCLGSSLEPPDELTQQTLAAVADAAAELIVRVQTEAALARTEASLRQSQKMDAIGLLAGGVAHDFNNLLTIILAYSEMGLSEVDPTHPLHELFAEINGAGERAAAMTRQLLAVSRQKPVRKTALNLNCLVDEMERMLTRLIGSSITLTVHRQDALWCVEADRNQLEQVLLNLVVNARDAMPTGGEIVITTGNRTLRHTDLLPDEARPGDFVELCIRDTGCGMDAATRSRIFEPFFTTKEAGRGTGMGLSTVFGIVNQAGGFIRVMSELGVGSAFCVYLPKSTTALAVRTITDRPETVPVGTERVLVVENDSAVRQLIRRLLEVRGYTVEEAADGGEALEILSQAAPPVDLVVTDIQMPVVGGTTLVRRLEELATSPKVLMMSGTTDHPAGFDSSVRFLSKPFTSDDLARHVRLVLDS